ncbi:MAG: hypothetical protein ACYS8L_08475 [Planctomycetota bacterium]
MSEDHRTKVTPPAADVIVETGGVRTVFCATDWKTAAAQIGVLQQKILDLRARLRWIPVGEGMPVLENVWSESVLTIVDYRDHGGSRSVQMSRRDGTTWGDGTTWDDDHVTHWMRLPPLPGETSME